MLTTREASAADAHAIAVVHVAAWRTGYRGLLSDQLLAGLDVDGRTEFWRSILMSDRDRSVLTVAELDNLLVGFADLQPSVEAPTSGTVSAIYVHPEHWSSGIGTALMRSVEVAAVTMTYCSLELRVLDENRRARRFYEGLGWATDGITLTNHLAENVAVDVVRYERSLT